jgi:hypothetical protein
MTNSNAPEVENPNPETPAQPNASAAPAPSDDAENSLRAESTTDESENAPKGSVNLAKAFSKINSALIALADQYVRRSVTVPQIDSEDMAAHTQNVGQAVAGVGGLTKNLLLATHGQHDPEGGKTVAYSSEKLRDVLIPKDDQNAIAAINATRSFVSKAAKLLGKDNPAVKTAQSQLSLIAEHGAEGINITDLIIACVNIPHPLIQNVARLHSGTKDGGHHPRLRAPRN